MKRNILYVDIDGVLADIESAYKISKQKTPEQPYPQSQYGFFMDLEPIKNSIQTVKKLQINYDIWFLTAPSFKNLSCYTEKAYWIKKHFGAEWVERLIICSDKSLLKGNYLVDDHSYGRGQDFFTGELIHFGTKEFNDWDKVFNYLTIRISKITPSANFVKLSPIDKLSIFEKDNKYWKEDEDGNITLIDTYENV